MVWDRQRECLGTDRGKWFTTDVAICLGQAGEWFGADKEWSVVVQSRVKDRKDEQALCTFMAAHTLAFTRPYQHVLWNSVLPTLTPNTQHLQKMILTTEKLPRTMRHDSSAVSYCAMMSTASLLLMNSHTPSLANTMNWSLGVSSTSLCSGSEITPTLRTQCTTHGSVSTPTKHSLKRWSAL